MKIDFQRDFGGKEESTKASKKTTTTTKEKKKKKKEGKSACKRRCLDDTHTHTRADSSVRSVHVH